MNAAKWSTITEIIANYNVVGIDNLNDYYDIRVKEGRLEGKENFTFKKTDLKDKEDIDDLLQLKSLIK